MNFVHFLFFCAIIVAIGDFVIINGINLENDEIIANDKKYYRVVDSQKNKLIHYQLHDIKHTFHNINDFENYLTKEYKDGDKQYYTFKFK